ncbi:hypothetical protein [Methylocella sp. CPCC 101449]|uniref:hypothetical protein n=1 Tax=Methylocella sp. CPCC 101449 TaxID=2987531 RepID=UPI00288D6A99|nr:hypothetical protein [Methylocella sp. CPCC 101449]MDT2021303.1 hypothetical protein [Methylocella sp. CPCC 101449]
MAVDLPADERLLQAAIMAAALVADPTTAANIAKLIEIEHLSAHPDWEIVPDDGSGTQNEASPAPQSEPSPTASVEPADQTLHGPGVETPLPSLSDTGVNHDLSFTTQPDVIAETSAPPDQNAVNDSASASLATNGGGIAITPAIVSTHEPETPQTSNAEQPASDIIPHDDLVRLPHTDDLIPQPADHSGTLISDLTDSLNLKLVDHVLDVATGLVGNIVHDVAIDTQHLVGSALQAVGDIVDLLPLPILHNDGSIEVPSLQGALHDTLDGLAAAVGGSPIPDLISDILPPANHDHDPGLVPLIVDHVLDSLTYHLHLL